MDNLRLRKLAYEGHLFHQMVQEQNDTIDNVRNAIKIGCVN